LAIGDWRLAIDDNQRSVIPKKSMAEISHDDKRTTDQTNDGSNERQTKRTTTERRPNDDPTSGGLARCTMFGMRRHKARH